MDDFDFMKPRSLLKSTVASPRDTGHAEYEHYEWPGDYFTTGEGEMLTRIRMEAQRSPGSRAHGAGHIRTLMTGYTFTLMNHPTAEVNQEYLLVQTTLFYGIMRSTAVRSSILPMSPRLNCIPPAKSTARSEP